jgi:hypothetical protein
MSVIDDLATAVANYATDDCDTTIVGYSVTTGQSTGPTATLNSGDEFQYQVEVINNGQFDMKNVKIRVNGTKWADVALSGSTGVFGSTALLDPTPPINIDAGKSFTTGFFRGKAKTGVDTNGVKKDIVTAQIAGWSGVLDHILNDRSGSGAAEGTLNKEVVAG